MMEDMFEELQEAREMAKMHDAQQGRRYCECGARAVVAVGGEEKCPSCVEAKPQEAPQERYTIDPYGVVSRA